MKYFLYGFLTSGAIFFALALLLYRSVCRRADLMRQRIAEFKKASAVVGKACDDVLPKKPGECDCKSASECGCK